MEHFLTNIHINQVRHLENIDIELSHEKRKHLILTGKNGSGKTSLLTEIKQSLIAINEGVQEEGLQRNVELCFNADDLTSQYSKGLFITAFFPADRLTNISLPHGVEEVKPKTVYSIDEKPVRDFVKYLVHLKTQQSYAKNENYTNTERNIEDWFEKFEK